MLVKLPITQLNTNLKNLYFNKLLPNTKLKSNISKSYINFL